MNDPTVLNDFNSLREYKHIATQGFKEQYLLPHV